MENEKKEHGELLYKGDTTDWKKKVRSMEIFQLKFGVPFISFFVILYIYLLLLKPEVSVHYFVNIFILMIIIYSFISYLKQIYYGIKRPPFMIYEKGIMKSYSLSLSSKYKMKFFPFSIIRCVTLFEPTADEKELDEKQRTDATEKQKIGWHSTIIQDRFFPRPRSGDIPIDHPNRDLLDVHYELNREPKDDDDFTMHFKFDQKIADDLGIDLTEDIPFDDDRLNFLGNPFFRVNTSADLIDDYQKVKRILLEKAREYGFAIEYHTKEEEEEDDDDEKWGMIHVHRSNSRKPAKG